MKAQTCQILDNLRISLEAAGALPADVVHINVYTLNTDDYVANGAPDYCLFGDTNPVRRQFKSRDLCTRIGWWKSKQQR